MIKKRRISFTALAVLLANTTALVAFSGVAAARMRSHDMSSLNLHHENRKDHRDRNDRHVARKHTKRKSHAKRSVECIKAPCSIDSGDRLTKLSHKHAHDRNKDKATGTATARGCGKLIVPTTGCATPARDPVGNTKPSLPKEAKQPTTPVRQPVIFHVKKPAPQSAIQPRNAATVAGELPNSPVGNTHTTAGPNPPTAVTVSNGVTTSQIQNGLGGLSVYSDKPGTITVSNGKESRKLSGASVTLSGNVVGVGGGQGVQVGPRNGEGKTVVAIKPTPETSPAGTLQKNDSRDVLKCFGCNVLGGVADFGYGITHGFAPGPVPPPRTSTTAQQ